MKTHIFVVGKSGAGKETVFKIFKEEAASMLSSSMYRFSDPLNEVLDILCLSRERQNQQKISTVLRQFFGEDTLSNAVAGKVLKDSSDVVFLDGVRRVSDLKAFDNLPNRLLIFVTAPPEIRFERLRKRGDRPGDKEKSWEQFQSEQNAEAESQIDSLAKVADVIIDNSGDMEALRKKIAEIIEQKLRPA